MRGCGIRCRGKRRCVPGDERRLKGEEVFGQVINLLRGELGGLAVFILRIAGGKHVADGRCRAVMQVRRSAPKLAERWRVELPILLIERVPGSDVVGMKVSEQRLLVAIGATGFGSVE